MTDSIRDDQFDRELRAFLAWQAKDTSGAPSATEAAARISSRSGTRARWRPAPQLIVDRACRAPDPVTRRGGPCRREPHARRPSKSHRRAANSVAKSKFVSKFVSEFISETTYAGWRHQSCVRGGLPATRGSRRVSRGSRDRGQSRG